MDEITQLDLTADPLRYLAEVADAIEPVLVSRPDGENVVIVSERAFNGMQTTIELLSTPVMADRLRRSIAELDRGSTPHAAE